MNLSNYRTGVQSLDLQIVELLKELPSEDADLIAELLVSGVRLSLEDVNRGELKLTNSALKELRHSFSVFAPYRSNGIEDEVGRHCVLWPGDRAFHGDCWNRIGKQGQLLRWQTGLHEKGGIPFVESCVTNFRSNWI